MRIFASIRGSGYALALAFALIFVEQASAQQVCRPDRLGLTDCGVTRPRPRPPTPFRTQIQALDAILGHTAPEAGASGLLPAGRRNSFGDILLHDGEEPPRRPCRADALGNLRCR